MNLQPIRMGTAGCSFGILGSMLGMAGGYLGQAHFRTGSLVTLMGPVGEAIASVLGFFIGGGLGAAVGGIAGATMGTLFVARYPQPWRKSRPAPKCETESRPSEPE